MKFEGGWSIVLATLKTQDLGGQRKWSEKMDSLAQEERVNLSARLPFHLSDAAALDNTDVLDDGAALANAAALDDAAAEDDAVALDDAAALNDAAALDDAEGTIVLDNAATLTKKSAHLLLI